MEYNNITFYSKFPNEIVELEAVEIISNFAAKIAFYNFEWRYITLVFFTTIQSTAIDLFLEKYSKSTVLKLGESIPKKRYGVPQYVLFGEESLDLIGNIEWLTKSGYDNTGNFILVCDSLEPKKCNEYDVFKTCLHVKLLNVVFIRRTALSSEPSAFTFYPVLEDKCFNTDPQILNMTTDCFNDDCFKNLFPDKLTNLKRCVITVSTFEQHPFMYLHNQSKPTGSDGEILDLIITAMNATLQVRVSEPNWGHFLNNNWTGSVGDVYSGRASMSVCSAPVTYNKYGNFQISFPYSSIEMVWVAALPPLRPSWEKLLYPLKIYIRIIILLLFILITFTNTLLKTRFWKKIRTDLNIGPPKYNILFYSWLLFLGMPLLIMPRKPSLLLIVYSWIWFSFIVRNVYQAALVGSLKEPVYEERFEKFNEVLEKNLPFGGQSSLKDYYTEDLEIYEKWTIVKPDVMYQTLDKISLGQSEFVMAMNSDTLLEYLMHYKGTRSVQIIPEKIVNSPAVMYFKKYSPLNAPVSHVLVSALEHGFTQRLYATFVSQRKLFFTHKTPESPEALKLNHFSGSITIVVIGWLMALAFFGIELFCGKLEDEFIKRGINFIH